MFHAVVDGNGTKPLRLALSPVLMPAQLGPAVATVTVIGAEWDLVESAVDVAVMVTEFAPVLAGVKVTAVPELTPDASLRVPAAAGLMEKIHGVGEGSRAGHGGSAGRCLGVGDSGWAAGERDGGDGRSCWSGDGDLCGPQFCGVLGRSRLDGIGTGRGHSRWGGVEARA